LSPEIGITSLPISCNLQALSNLHYFLSGFMNYFWSYLDEMHHSKRQSHRFILVMLRLELHIASASVVEKLSLGLRPICTSCFSGHSNLEVGQISDRSWVMGNDSLQIEVPLLELSRFGILLGEWEEGQITSSDWPFVSAILGQIVHLVTSITLGSARSCVMQSAFLTQETVSIIPIVFSWSGSISSNSFLPLVLLWLVIIVAVISVGVTVVVVVKSSYVFKRSFVITCPGTIFPCQKLLEFNPGKLSLVQLLQENTDSVGSNQWISPTAPSEPLKLKAFAMLAACASIAAETLSATNYLMAARVMAGALDVDVLLGGILST
nr:hypothetical protein [Tanacetum cinerariifolium]